MTLGRRQRGEVAPPALQHRRGAAEIDASWHCCASGAGMRERDGVEGPVKLLVDRDADGVSAGNLYSDVGRWGMRWGVPARTWCCCASGAGKCE